MSTFLHLEGLHTGVKDCRDLIKTFISRVLGVSKYHPSPDIPLLGYWRIQALPFIAVALK